MESTSQNDRGCTLKAGVIFVIFNDPWIDPWTGESPVTFKQGNSLQICQENGQTIGAVAL